MKQYTVRNDYGIKTMIHPIKLFEVLYPFIRLQSLLVKTE